MEQNIKHGTGVADIVFLAGLHEEVVIESGGDPSNFRRDNLFNNLLSFLAAHLSKAGGRLKFSIRNLFGRFARLRFDDSRDFVFAS
jgi:hypothetical protein